MAYKPILFNTEMVRAILDGRKTQTRRLTKIGLPCYFEPGDIMWVRETWQYFPINKPTNAVPVDFKPYKYLYLADGEVANSSGEPFRWRPSIHMPKEAARIFLRVKNVRTERLQNITVEDCMWEGLRKCDWDFCPEKFLKHTECENCTALQSYKNRFRELWDSTIKPADLPKYGWDANPWVWVIEFERIEKPESW